MTVDLDALEAAVKAMTPGRWHVVDQPWGDGTLINAGSPDPHGGCLVADCGVLDDWEEGNEPRACEDAAGIVALVNDAPELIRLARIGVAVEAKDRKREEREERAACNRHRDCGAADEAARLRGQFAAEHCYDGACEECFGS